MKDFCSSTSALSHVKIAKSPNAKLLCAHALGLKKLIEVALPKKLPAAADTYFSWCLVPLAVFAPIAYGLRLLQGGRPVVPVRVLVRLQKMLSEVRQRVTPYASHIVWLRRRFWEVNTTSC